MNEQREAIGNILDNSYRYNHAMYLDEHDDAADDVIAHLWQRADDPEVVEAVAAVTGRSPAFVKLVKHYLMAELLGPRPAEQERRTGGGVMDGGRAMNETERPEPAADMVHALHEALVNSAPEWIIDREDGELLEMARAALTAVPTVQAAAGDDLHAKAKEQEGDKAV